MSTVQTTNIKHNASAGNNITLDSAGNVGVGTASPAQRLDVAGNVLLSGQSTAEQFIRIGSGRTGNGFSYLDLQGDTTYSGGMRVIRLNNGANSSSNIEHRGTGALQLVTYEAGPVNFFTNSTERMRVTESGNVGIGTASPAQRLTVNGSVFMSGGDGTAVSWASDLSSHYVRFNSSLNGLQMQGFGGLAFLTGGANERMRITSDGRVGIGTASPINSLDVVGGNARVRWNVSTGSNACIQATTNVAANAYATQIYDADYHGFRVFGTDRFFVDGSFAYCIGVGARSGTGPVLTTNNSLGSLFRNAGYIEFNSDVGAIGLNYFVSDETKKDNIQPSVFSSSALVAQVNFISFDWKPESGQTGHVDVGVSAQQLQSLDGRLVKELSDGTLMVNEPALIAHLAKAVQELIAKNEALEARVAALETK